MIGFSAFARRSLLLAAFLAAGMTAPARAQVKLDVAASNIPPPDHRPDTFTEQLQNLTAQLHVGRSRLRGLDYRTVFTSDRYPTRASEWLQPRYSVTATDTVASVRGIITRPHRVADLRARASSAFKRRR